MIGYLFVFLFRLKKRYQHCVEKLKEYLDSVKDFGELVSPQSLFLHFLGSKLSTKVRKNLEVVRKSKCFYLLLSFLLLLLLLYFFIFYFCLVLSGMTTRFSKQKLAKAQEKKAKDGTVSGLLSKKKASDISKKDPMTTLPLAHSPAKRLASPTSSLEMIASDGKEIRKKNKLVVNLSFLPSRMTLTQQLGRPMRHFLWMI